MSIPLLLPLNFSSVLISHIERGMQDAAAIERACVQFQTAINPNDRAAAESVIQAFRTLEQPYPLCQYLLTHSTQPLTHFHALSVLRDALLREWGSLSKEFISQIREFLIKVYYLTLPYPALSFNSHHH
jgi:hypothetical protein